MRRSTVTIIRTVCVRRVQLDAKNSPLALLAQTCSSIGKDPTPPLVPNSSQKLTSGGSKDSSSSASTHHHHHNHHAGKDDKVRPKSESPQFRGDDHRASTATKCPGGGARDRLKDSSTARPGAAGSSSGKGQSPPKSGSRTSSIKDSSDRLSPAVDGISALSSRGLMRDAIGGKPTAAAAVVSSSVGAGLLQSSNASGVGKAAVATSLPSSLFDVGAADSVQRFAALHQQLSLAVAAAAAAGRGTGYVYGSMPPLFPPLDHHAFAGAAAPAATPAAAAALYPGSLPGAAGQFQMFGPHVDPIQLQQLYAAAAMAAQSPSMYADYAARLKAAATSTAATCKDPFCVRCPLGAGPCCGGAASSAVPSTAADKHPVGSAAASLLPSAGAAVGSSMLAQPLPFLPTASLHALLLQQMSAAAAAAAAATSGGSSATGDPLSGVVPALNSGGGVGVGSYTCSWVDSAADFCGMHFNSSDELLQHLRVHASAADPSGASLPPPPHPAALAALTASFPLGLGSSLPRLSPAPPLAGADVQPPSSGSAFGPMPPPHGFSPSSSSRYHPYKSPPAGAAPAFSSPAGLPSLAAAGLPGTATAPPPGAAPLFPPALAAFYSPYAALYGHRLGAAAVGP